MRESSVTTPSPLTLNPTEFLHPNRSSPHALQHAQYRVILDSLRRGESLVALSTSPALAATFRPEMDDPLRERVRTIMAGLVNS